jgi:hypothetical protein
MCKNLYRCAQGMLTLAFLCYAMYCRISVRKELPDWPCDCARQAVHILVDILWECVDYERGRLLELLKMFRHTSGICVVTRGETWQASRTWRSRVFKTYGILDTGLREEKCLYSDIVFSHITASLGMFVLVIRW